MGLREDMTRAIADLDSTLVALGMLVQLQAGVIEQAVEQLRGAKAEPLMRLADTAERLRNVAATLVGAQRQQVDGAAIGVPGVGKVEAWTWGNGVPSGIEPPDQWRRETGSPSVTP